MPNDNDDSREGSCEKGQDDIENRLPDMNCLIRGKQYEFAVGKRIARGKFGGVYEVLMIGSLLIFIID